MVRYQPVAKSRGSSLVQAIQSRTLTGRVGAG